MPIIAVGCGGFLGSIFRYLVNLALRDFSFPLGTLAVNGLGSALAGFLFGAIAHRGTDSALWLFLVTGFSGGLTTFSTFSLEFLQLVRTQQWGLASISVLANLALALIGVFAGHAASAVTFRG